MIRNPTPRGRRAREYRIKYKSLPMRPPYFEFDENGMPFKPREYGVLQWTKFLEKCEKVKRKYRVSYRQIIDEKLVAFPRTQYRVRNRLGGLIQPYMIERVIEKLISRGHTPFVYRIGDGLGISRWTLRRLAERYNIQLPYCQPWRKPMVCRGKKYIAPPPASSFGRSG